MRDVLGSELTLRGFTEDPVIVQLAREFVAACRGWHVVAALAGAAERRRRIQAESNPCFKDVSIGRRPPCPPAALRPKGDWVQLLEEQLETYRDTLQAFSLHNRADGAEAVVDTVTLKQPGEAA